MRQNLQQVAPNQERPIPLPYTPSSILFIYQWYWPASLTGRYDNPCLCQLYPPARDYELGLRVNSFLPESLATIAETIDSDFEEDSVLTFSAGKMANGKAHRREIRTRPNPEDILI